MSACRGIVMAGVFLAVFTGAFARPSCVGESPEDRKNAKELCSTGITKGLEPFIKMVVGRKSVLEIGVTREMALSMRSDPLDAKKAVLTWMQMWKRITGYKAVSVYVEWDGISIATGSATMFSGDQVEIHE